MNGYYKFKISLTLLLLIFVHRSVGSVGEYVTYHFVGLMRVWLTNKVAYFKNCFIIHCNHLMNVINTYLFVLDVSLFSQINSCHLCVASSLV